MGATDEGDPTPDDRHASHELALERRDGGTETISASEDETVLDAAERAGAILPFGCRIGTCATCTGRVREGTLEHARPPRGLKPRQLGAGYALLCIAEPRADCRIEVGADVRSALLSNPWR